MKMTDYKARHFHSTRINFYLITKRILILNVEKFLLEGFQKINISNFEDYFKNPSTHTTDFFYRIFIEPSSTIISDAKIFSTSIKYVFPWKKSTTYLT